MSEKQVRDYDKFMLRFPDGMRDAIAERAKRNGRSMNAEIIQIIEDALMDESFRSVIIIDEAHRSSEAKTLNLKELEEVMEKVVNKALIGFTATPMDKKK